MRLRKSNQEKRFDSVLFTGISDGEQEPSARKGQELSDEEFIVDVSQEQDGQNGHSIDVQDLSDLESGDDKQTEPQRKKNRRSWAPNPVNSFAQVQPYPTDPSQKWTRTYVGPVKRWTRLEHLVHYWFSNKENRKDVFSEFMELWFNYELLPPRLLQGSEQIERARNGWMPDNFTQGLEDKFCRWYERYLGSRSKPQSSTLIEKSKALRCFLPQAEGEMSVLLGHISGQKEYSINQGGCISFSESGLPIEDEHDCEVHSSGWLLDVGGIVLSMGWAPINDQAGQLLAMAVVPHSDQAFYMDPNDAPKATEMKEGSIQIWKFEAERDSQGIIRPARISPKIVQAICFHWGRVRRMQWCPVPLSTEHRIALLAMLCGDGKLRLIEVKRDPERDSTGAFGMHSRSYEMS